MIGNTIGILPGRRRNFYLLSLQKNIGSRGRVYQAVVLVKRGKNNYQIFSKESLKMEDTHGLVKIFTIDPYGYERLGL